MTDNEQNLLAAYRAFYETWSRAVESGSIPIGPLEVQMEDVLRCEADVQRDDAEESGEEAAWYEELNRGYARDRI